MLPSLRGHSYHSLFLWNIANVARMRLHHVHIFVRNVGSLNYLQWSSLHWFLDRVLRISSFASSLSRRRRDPNKDIRVWASCHDNGHNSSSSTYDNVDDNERVVELVMRPLLLLDDALEGESKRKKRSLDIPVVVGRPAGCCRCCCCCSRCWWSPDRSYAISPTIRSSFSNILAACRWSTDDFYRKYHSNMDKKKWKLEKLFDSMIHMEIQLSNILPVKNILLSLTFTIRSGQLLKITLHQQLYFGDRTRLYLPHTNWALMIKSSHPVDRIRDSFPLGYSCSIVESNISWSGSLYGIGGCTRSLAVCGFMDTRIKR